VDRRAPAELKSSAQSLLAFLLLGVGFLLGAKGAGFMMGKYPAQITNTPPRTVVEISDAAGADKEMPHRVLVTQTRARGPAETLVRLDAAEGMPYRVVVKRADEPPIELDDGVAKITLIKNPLPRWDAPAGVWRYLDLSGTVKGLLPKKGDKKEEPDLDLAQQLDTDPKNGKITIAEIEAFPDYPLKVDKKAHLKEDLIWVFEQIASKQEPGGDAGSEDDGLTRVQWLKAQSYDWKWICIWPALAAFVICAIFMLAFRDKPETDEPENADAQTDDSESPR